MTRFVAAFLIAVAAVVSGAPTALADPADLVPYCSGDQTPMDNNCREDGQPGVHQRQRERGEPGRTGGHQPGRPAGDLERPTQQGRDYALSTTLAQNSIMGR